MPASPRHYSSIQSGSARQPYGDTEIFPGIFPDSAAKGLLSVPPVTASYPMMDLSSLPLSNTSLITVGTTILHTCA